MYLVLKKMGKVKISLFLKSVQALRKTKTEYICESWPKVCGL